MRDFSKVKRVVVKVGTSNLTGKDNRLDEKRIGRLAEQLVWLRKSGREAILVTSGAIGAGIGKLRLKQKPRDMPMLQASAAVGQNILMHAYEKNFSKLGQNIAQVLLTHEDFRDRKKYLNFQNTLKALLKLGVIPIINENDTVSVEEIVSGDNDSLSVLVAASAESQLLVILSDTVGLCTQDPRRSRNANLIRVVESITPEMRKACGRGTSKGRGGMSTKLFAAEKAMEKGIPMVLADGSDRNILERILDGEEVGTLFLPKKGLTDKKHWIKYTAPSKGEITIDEGAARAIHDGKTLLPAGVVRGGVKGNFKAGDTITLLESSAGRQIARGITNYSSDELGRVSGLKTAEVDSVLGQKKSKKAVLDRDNMVFV